MDAQQICDSLVHETEGVRVCVVRDLKTGITLASCRHAAVDGAETAHMIRTASDFCQSKLLRQYAVMLNPPRPPAGLIREAQISTTSAHIFLTAVTNLPDVIMICSTDKTVNIGFGWIALHRAADQLAAAGPLSPAAAPPAADTGAAGTLDAAIPPARPARAASAGEPTPVSPAARQTKSESNADTKPAKDVSAPGRPAEPAPADDPPPRAARTGARAVFSAKPPRDLRK